MNASRSLPRFLNFVLQPCGVLCNLKCDYCYARAEAPKKRGVVSSGKSPSPDCPETAATVFLSWFPRLLAQINGLDEVGLVRFTWHGGEPLLAPSGFYPAVIDLQRQWLQRPDLSHDNVLMTNGMLLQRSTICLLDELDVAIGVSCDGPAWKHNAPRAKTDTEFRRIASAFENLRAEHAKYSVFVVVHQDNKDSAESISAWLDELQPGHGVSITPCAGADGSVSSEEYAAFLIRLYDLWTKTRTPDVALFQNVEAGLSYTRPNLCQLVGNRCRSFITASFDGDLHSGCQAGGRDDGFLGSVCDRGLEELMRIHLSKSRQLESSLTNESLFGLLGEQAPYVYFQGQGCPNRSDDAGQDPYAAAIASLIKHVYESDRPRFNRNAAKKIGQLLKGHLHA